MVMGIFIGLYYGWKLALLVLAVCPLMALGLAMRIKYKASFINYSVVRLRSILVD